jgi:hypothetical protein
MCERTGKMLYGQIMKGQKSISGLRRERKRERHATTTGVVVSSVKIITTATSHGSAFPQQKWIFCASIAD